jgi:hypothetical protein
MRINALIYISIGLLLISCRNDKEDKPNYVPLSESIKPYKFKTGSYWIYVNDTTGDWDSIRVTSIENDLYWCPPPMHGSLGQQYEYYKINLENFRTFETYNDYLTSYWIKRNGGGQYGELGQPIFMANEEIGEEFNGMEIIDKLPAMEILGNTFFNVDKIKITATNQYQIEFEYDTYLYYSNTIGLIKWETDFGEGNIESWSIKRWNVIK